MMRASSLFTAISWRKKNFFHFFSTHPLVLTLSNGIKHPFCSLLLIKTNIERERLKKSFGFMPGIELKGSLWNALPDQPTNRPTDRHSQLQRCFVAPKDYMYATGLAVKTTRNLMHFFLHFST